MRRGGDGHVFGLYVSLYVSMEGGWDATGRDLPMSIDEVVEKLGGLLGRCRCWWMREDGTMVGFLAMDA